MPTGGSLGNIAVRVPQKQNENTLSESEFEPTLAQLLSFCTTKTTTTTTTGMTTTTITTITINDI